MTATTPTTTASDPGAPQHDPGLSGADAPGPERRRFALGVEGIGLYVISLAVAVALSALLVSATGGSASSVFTAILDGSLRSPGRWGVTAVQAAPLLAVALGVVISNRAGLANIGPEGQVIMGAAITAFVAVRFPGPGPLALIVGIGAGIAAGALWAGIAAVLKYTRGVPEVITTLLLIFVANHLLTYGLTRRWLLLDRDPDRTSRVDTGELLPTDTRLPTWTMFGNGLDLSVVIALVFAAAIALMLAKTVTGFRLKMLGQSPRTAQRSGVSAKGVGTIALMASGALAGLGGAMLLTGGVSANRLTIGFSNNLGWEGLLVALLARSKPLAAIPMAFVFASLRTGSGFLAATGVDRRIVDVVQALLVLALLFPPAIQFIRERRRQLAAVRS